MPRWLNWVLRRFTKYVANPMTLRQVARGDYKFAVLHTVGRKSGRAYATPLEAEPIAGGFAIPLVYGDDTDWCRNLLAAGKGTLDVRGESVPIFNPMVVEVSTVEGQMRVATARHWKRFGFQRCLRVDRAQPAGETVPEVAASTR